jgi:hypothetical protein
MRLIGWSLIHSAWQLYVEWLGHRGIKGMCTQKKELTCMQRQQEGGHLKAKEGLRGNQKAGTLILNFQNMKK